MFWVWDSDLLCICVNIGEIWGKFLIGVGCGVDGYVKNDCIKYIVGLMVFFNWCRVFVLIYG